MNATQKTYASLALGLSITGWSLSPIFIRLLSDAYDPYTQAFGRYASSAAVMITVSLLWYRGDLLQLMKHPGPVIGIGMLNAFQQWLWTYACYDAPATVAQLVTKINVVFVIVLSFVLFHEERKLIRHPLYLAGTAASLVGVALVLADKPGSLVPQLDRYSLALIVTALSWAVYSVWGKHIVVNVHPVPMFTVLACYTTLGLGAMSLSLGETRGLIHADARTTLIMIVSGILPIAGAHTGLHYAQRYFGAAFCSSVMLLLPIITYVLAIPILGREQMVPAQWIGGVTLIAGTFAVTWAGIKAHSKSVEEDANAT